MQFIVAIGKPVMTKTGFIGLGRMGRGMASNLLTQIGELAVYDHDSSATQTLVDRGAVACGTAAELASQTTLIFLCLPYAPEVRETLFGRDGICAAANQDTTVIDTTTLNRSDAIEIGAEARDKGIAYWDCPVSGMPFRADNGTLTVMFGGSEEAFARWQPQLQAFGDVVTHCGALGAGQAMKALNNIIYNVNIAALCEVLPLSQALGLDPEQVANVVTSASSRSFAAEYFVPRILNGQFDSDFSMNNAYKDIVNVQRMALDTRAQTPVVNAMINSYQAAMAAGLGDQPKSAMIKLHEQALGVEFRHRKED